MEVMMRYEPISPIKWEESFDGDGNSYWEGFVPSVFGSFVAWRLSKRLRDNEVQWYADHDAELADDDQYWTNLHRAMRDIQKQHDARLVEISELRCDDE